MSTPGRVQLSRAKGWKMPENTVRVSRPGRWGNPFIAHDWQASFRAVALGCRGDRAGRNQAAVQLFRMWLEATPSTLTPADLEARSWFDREVMTLKLDRSPPTKEEIKAELRGKNLACWCKAGEPCHADVLLELANE